MRSHTILAFSLSSLLAACTAYIDGPAGSDPSGLPGPSGVSAPTGDQPAPTAISPQAAADFPLPAGAGARPRLWRLTEAQYRSALKDALGLTDVGALPADDGGAFGNRADLLDVSPLLLAAYSDIAEKAAEQLIPAKLAELATCQPLDAANAICADSLIRGVGKRLWRRALTDDEVSALKKLHTDVTAQLDGNAGLQAVLQALLTSPKLVFRSEVGAPVSGSTSRRLTPDEVASALSFGLWGTTPDAPLLDAAAQGKLAQASDIAAQARSMLQDPRARDVASDFVARWLGIDDVANSTKSAPLFPAFSATLMQSIANEAQQFAGATLWNGGGGLRALLTSTSAFVSAQTAPLYGLKSAPAVPQLTELNPAERLGILTQAAFLSAHASEDATKPVLRGKFIRENLLCQNVPAPPPNVNVDIPAAGPNQTARERFVAHSTDPSCSGCHQLFDGLGFAFENYDALGQYRTLDNGKVVDASGTLSDPASGTSQSFRNALDLVRMLADNDQTYRCFTQRLFESFFGRTPVQSDVPDLERAQTAFHDAGYDVKSLLAQLATSDGFLQRQAQ